MSMLQGKAITPCALKNSATHTIRLNASRWRTYHLRCSRFAQQRLDPQAVASSAVDHQAEVVVSELDIVPGHRLESWKPPVYQEAKQARQCAEEDRQFECDDHKWWNRHDRHACGDVWVSGGETDG